MISLVGSEMCIRDRSSVMIKIYVRFSIRTCKEGNNKISSFSKVTDVPQMSFLKFAKQEIAHAHKIGCYSMARNYGTAIRSFKKQ